MKNIEQLLEQVHQELRKMPAPVIIEIFKTTRDSAIRIKKGLPGDQVSYKELLAFIQQVSQRNEA
ncbi:hypothetical protein [Priestia megaterium]|uniref:hypothetical protein n=1 Tax=Priestia megaterium TaxID=1404 RepID=UPI001A943056|nr:hypothetical protein [Priestia megaterium]QSX20031.1 hypothetical protein J0P05_22780 [Priestia megaterium]